MSQLTSPTTTQEWAKIDQDWLVLAADETPSPPKKKPAPRRKKTPAPRPTA
jgi:hypothetical protein